jgi:hypothetical protein
METECDIGVTNAGKVGKGVGFVKEIMEIAFSVATDLA